MVPSGDEELFPTDTRGVPLLRLELAEPPGMRLVTATPGVPKDTPGELREEFECLRSEAWKVIEARSVAIEVAGFAPDLRGT